MSGSPSAGKVTFVVIGRNEEKNLGRCLESVQRQIAGTGHDVIYVDSRSTDRSVEIAKSFPGVRVHILEDQKPSAAKARNAGWRLAVDAELIHFVDGDTVLADGWLQHALTALRDAKVGAVFGRFREMHPDASFYNKVADLDWPRDVGPVETFGGIVMVRRACLVEADGFDERLRVGEDPALALEIRRHGHQILQLEQLMAWHDIDLHSFRAYWKRNVMVGWSMAEISYRNRGHAVSAWAGKTLRTLILLLGGVVVVALGVLVTPWLLAAGVLLAGLDLVRIARNNLRRAGNWADAIVYALHARTIMFPVALGHWKWYRERPRD